MSRLELLSYKYRVHSSLLRDRQAAIHLLGIEEHPPLFVRHLANRSRTITSGNLSLIADVAIP